MIKAAIFDMDGTITDTEKCNVEYWIAAGKEFGFDVAEEDILYIRSLEAKKSAEYLASKYPGFDYYEVREVRRRFMREYVDNHGVEAKPGVEKLLTYLKARGVKIALATATKYEHAERYMKELGFFDLFDKIVCTSMVEHGKPAPDVFLYACECVGERPEDCLAVEDSPNGIRSASSAGCRTVMVPDLTPADDELRGLIVAEVPTLSDIIGLIETGRL